MNKIVGFVGVGNIGTPIVLSLLRGGFDVVVRDLRKDQAAECIAAGARFAESNEELMSECDVVGIAVVNDQQLTSLFTSNGGLIEVARAGTTLIVHSTVLPKTIKSLGEEVDRAGLKMIDAQVSGGDLRAREGDLAVMCGGDLADVETNQEYFDAISRTTEYFGPRGSGAGAKIAIQMMTFGNWMAAIECMRLARGLGIDEKKLAEFTNDTTGYSWVSQVWGNYDRLLHTHPLAGTDDLFRMFDKDLFNAVLVARDHQISLPVTAVSSQVMEDAMKERIELSAPIYGKK